jgi:hypothetical protein
MFRTSVLLSFLMVFLASGLSAQDLPVPGIPWNTPASILLQNLQREGYVLSIYNGALYVLKGPKGADVRVVYLNGRFERYSGAWSGPDVVRRGVPMLRAALDAYGPPTLVVRMGGDTIPPDSAAQWESWPVDLPFRFRWQRDGAMLEIILFRTPSGTIEEPTLTVTAEVRGYTEDRLRAVTIAYAERRIRARNSGKTPQDTTHWTVLGEGGGVRESLFRPVVTRTGPGQVRGWVEIDGATLGESGPTTATFLTEHNCRNRTRRSLGIVVRVRGGGEPKALFDAEPRWEPVPAGSGSRVHAALCAHPSARSE